MKERTHAILLVGVFAALYFIPFNNAKVSSALLEAFYVLQEYVREHVLFYLVPAFFIAGAIAHFVSQGAVIPRIHFNINVEVGRDGERKKSQYFREVPYPLGGTLHRRRHAAW
jgi:hypothetical protein